MPAKKILVVDDDPVILKALSFALEHSGYEVLTAVDGPEAFSIVRRNRPDLILLDIFFPPDAFQSGNTWDAFLIVQWLQRMGEPQARHIPIIVVSGAKPEEFKSRSLAVGALAYFQKPVEISDLLDTIHQVFHPRVSETAFEGAAVSNSEHLRLARYY
ncbi:MAG: response regulator [Verrucomicrobiia bacterium]